MNKSDVCLIVTTLNDLKLDYYANVFKIGVERGCLDLINKNLGIDLAISDFDHVTDEELDLIKVNAKEFTLLNREKYYIDGECAIMQAQKLGYKKIIFIAKPTKREDMNFSVFSLVANYNIEYVNETSKVFQIPIGTTTLDFDLYQDYTYVSFFAKQVGKITLKDFQYEATDLLIEPFSINAISNAFIPYKNPVIKTNVILVCVVTK